MAADVLTVVADVVPGGAAVHVVGHSLGAMISCKVAGVLAAEKRLASLTLLSGSLVGWFNMIPPITAKLFRTLPKLATASTAHRRADADLDCHYTDAYVAEHRGDLMGEYVTLSNSQKRFDEGRQRAKTGEDGHLAAVFKHRVTAADLAAVRDSGARVVVAHGRHDFVAGVSAGETLWRAFKDAGCAVADYHVLHGAHFIQREREIEINGLVNAQVAGGAIDAPPVAAEAPPNFGCYAALFFLACPRRSRSRPDTAGLFYVDLDAAAAWPWAATTASKKRRAFQRSVHDVNGSDVVFEHARGAFTTWWRVHGSRFYARDAPFARAFLRRWFGNRCSFKDQYSLWHSILEEADLGGCVRYGGELWRDLTYNEAKQTTPAELAARYPELALSCRSMEGGAAMALLLEHGTNPPLVDALAHASIPDRRAALRKFHYRDAAGTRKVLDVEAAVVVFENDRPTLGVLDAAPSTNGELLADLGIDARDVAVHPWW
ncbi:10-hydroxy-9-(phosphonooxy)octadecanoate phosphatase [Aureococcus anophagefferens]|nr:10-hydroxy-9-(phosphonooxy)octadecanoate phosphatase [Aureococcus anophagefferens]